MKPIALLQSILAFFWGVLFTINVRRLYDYSFPFVKEFLSSSSVAYITGILFLSAFYFAFRHSSRQSPARIFATALLLTSAAASAYFFFKDVRFQFPLAVILLELLVFVLFATRLPPLFSKKAELLTGAFAGIFIGMAEWKPEISLSAALLFAAIPAAFFLTVSETKPMLHRLTGIRRITDFLRYFLLASIAQGIFETYRHFFFPAFGLLLAVHALRYLIARFYAKREHIRYGMYFLPVIILFSGIAFARLPLPVWGVLSYGLLSLWETIYFKRSDEAALLHEHLLPLGVLALLLILSFLPIEQITIATGLVLSIASFFLLFFTFKKTRALLISLFAASGVLYAALSWQSLDRSLSKNSKSIASAEQIHAKHLSILPGSNPLSTNVFPEPLVRKLRQDAGIQVFYFNPSSLFTIQSIGRELSRGREVYYRIPISSPYHAAELQGQIHSHFSGKKVLFEKTNNDISTMPSSTATETTLRAGIYSLQYYLGKAEYEKARILAEELRLLFPENSDLLLLHARTLGALGNTAEQIGMLETFFASNGTGFLTERQMLLDLYLLSVRHSETMRLAALLVQQDPDNTLTYMRAMYQSLTKFATPYEWQQFYYKAMNLPNTFQPGKNSLLSDIRERIRESPPMYDLFKEELERQETLEFPE